MKINSMQYAKSLYELTENKSRRDVDNIIVKFTELLKKNNQLKMADKIIAKFNDLYNQKHKIVEAEAITARELENSQISKIERYIKDKYKAKEVIIKNKIDENLKGGIVIKIKDEILDASVGGKINRLKSVLTK